MTDRPVKFGAICAPALASMLWNEFYQDDKQMVLDLCDIMNAEFREMADAGCPLIQVEEPPHHGRSTRPDCTEADLEFLTEAFNRQLVGVDAEIWVHTCWGGSSTWISGQPASAISRNSAFMMSQRSSTSCLSS